MSRERHRIGPAIRSLPLDPPFAFSVIAQLRPLLADEILRRRDSSLRSLMFVVAQLPVFHRGPKLEARVHQAKTPSCRAVAESKTHNVQVEEVEQAASGQIRPDAFLYETFERDRAV